MLEPDKIYEEIMRCGAAWSDRDAAASILEETKAIVFAELFNSQPNELSIAVREHAARADPSFRLHVTNMVAARKEANWAKVKLRAAETLAELRRSEETSRRAEMSIR